jgi:hypothetical protein
MYCALSRFGTRKEVFMAAHIVHDLTMLNRYLKI